MRNILFVLIFAIAAQGGTVVIPNGLENTEGDTSVGGLFGGDQRRTQVIYSSQQFSAVPADGCLISEARFRMDGRFNSGFSAGADLEIHLSTSKQNPESLNPVFASNIGANETTVLPRTILSFSSSAVPGGPNSFSVVIPFPTRFYYKPADGNLLMDAFVFSAAAVPNLDWQDGLSDGVSASIGGVASSVGNTIHTGLITEFVFQPVPEASSLSLILLPIVGVLFWRKNVTS